MRPGVFSPGRIPSSSIFPAIRPLFQDLPVDTENIFIEDLLDLLCGKAFLLQPGRQKLHVSGIGDLHGHDPVGPGEGGDGLVRHHDLSVLEAPLLGGKCQSAGLGYALVNADDFVQLLHALHAAKRAGTGFAG